VSRMNLVARDWRWARPDRDQQYTAPASSSQAKEEEQKVWERNTSDWAEACRQQQAK